MLRLGINGVASAGWIEPIIGRVAFAAVDADQRCDHVLVTADPASVNLSGYIGALSTRRLAESEVPPLPPIVHALAGVDHLASGDVVALHPSGYVRTLYRVASRHNTLFATDRCNSLCLMCSQPPRPVDDRTRVKELLRTIGLMSRETEELGITGGEPTLLGDGLVEVVEACKATLPGTALHILSNGRLFSYGAFARRLAGIEHPDLMVGIPLYSDVDSEHDYIVQAQGAFDEAVIGLHNLARAGVRVEVRVVVHRLTVARLAKLSEFIFRNLTFAAQVAFMGLEPIGLAVPNLDELWIDPCDYSIALEEAVLHIAARGIGVSIYNHQLCVLPRSLWPFAVRSISDWKNEYADTCGGCAMRGECGGFFASSVHLGRVSRSIRPFARDPRAHAADSERSSPAVHSRP